MEDAPRYGKKRARSTITTESREELKACCDRLEKTLASIIEREAQGAQSRAERALTKLHRAARRPSRPR